VHLLGPNGLGIQRPQLQLNASVAGPLARGPLALVSQSGALTSSMLDWAATTPWAFRRWCRWAQHGGRHRRRCSTSWPPTAQTHSIVVYMEGISNARRFMSALRSAANAKPVVVLKAGRKPAGNEAAQTHSGAIVGSDDVFDAALRRAGAVRVRPSWSCSRPPSAWPRATGRWAAPGHRHQWRRAPACWRPTGSMKSFSTGQAVARIGARAATAAAALASLTDLIDLSEDAGPEHYRAAMQAASQRPPDRRRAGHLFAQGRHRRWTRRGGQGAGRGETHHGKPLLTCWMGDASVGEARAC
jgi:acetyltransferase